MLTEGWDRPEASCLILARPTKSLGLYRQMVGRVLRTAPAVGKTDALILDHSGAVFKHGFPDNEIVWTKHEDRRAVNVTHSKRGQYRAPGLTTCHSFDSKLKFYGQLLYIAGERGYQRGWAAHKYKEKFGDWPASRYADPIPPSPDVRAWVRSSQIAYAKAMQAQPQ